MTREDIIKLAREVGLLPDNLHPTPQTHRMAQKQKNLERFAALVAEHEREQCALIAAHILKMPQNDISTLIRARGMRHE